MNPREPHQKQRDARSIIFHGTLILMTNHLPLFDYNNDEALRHRIGVIPFKTTFKKDNAFKNRMKEPARLDALFTLLCEGAKDALANPSFHQDVHPELNPNPNATSTVYRATVEAMEYCKDPRNWNKPGVGSTHKPKVAELLCDWYLKTCETAEDAQIKVTNLWNSFKSHCNEHSQDPKGFKKKYFLPFMEEKGHSISTDNHSVRFYTGIQWKARK